MDNFKKVITFDEYEGRVPACLRAVKPKCPHVAVIPSITVSNNAGLKGLSDCFVHVSDTNTTYYIDEKPTITTIWAGPVEYNNYDFEANPLGLRGQYVVDSATGVSIYYDQYGVMTSLSGPKGATGETGNGISSTVLNDDYTLTINYTDGTSVTTGSVRGETGPAYELTDDDKANIANLVMAQLTNYDEEKF